MCEPNINNSILLVAKWRHIKGDRFSVKDKLSTQHILNIMMSYYAFSTKKLAISFLKWTWSSLFLHFQSWNKIFFLQLTTELHIDRFGQKQKYTALWSYSVQAYICPMSCPTKKSATKNAGAHWQIWFQRNINIAITSVFCVCNRILKGSQNFDGLISCIVKFSSIIQIHYSTLIFILILIQRYIKIDQNVSIGSAFNISASVFIMSFFMEKKRLSSLKASRHKNNTEF